MTRRNNNPRLPTKGSEAKLQEAIIDAALKLGWGRSLEPELVYTELIYHTKFSVMSNRGWPDLVLVNPRWKRTAYVELKGPLAKTSVHQIAFLRGLQDAGNEVYLWRNEDMDTAIEVLRSPVRIPALEWKP